MNEEALGWFHCGRCGKLFQSQLGHENRTCPECGQHPSTFGETPLKTGPSGYAPLPEKRTTVDEGSQLTQKRLVKKRRGISLMYKIIMAWAASIVLIAVVAHHFWEEDDRLGMQVRSPLIPKDAIGDEERAILEEAMPQCARCLGGFLGSGTPELRNQYVWRPLSVAGKMARFYGSNPLSQINPADVKNTERRLLNLETGPAIVSEWEVVDGRKLDAVFFKEDGEWRLDWEQFVRYGEQPWPLFLAGSGNESAEFRLMARLKSSEAKSRSDQLSIVLYSPRFGYPGDPGNASSDFLVRRDSKEGSLLAAAFQAKRNGKSPFDASLTTYDPEEMIRVRVRVRRTEETNGRSFEIEKVINCHWLSIDEPGLAPLTKEEMEEEKAAIRDADQPSKRTD